MNSPNRLLEANDECFQTRSRAGEGSRIMHLLAGLERQKEELGPIADELIGLLHRLGVAGSSETHLPRSKR